MIFIVRLEDGTVGRLKEGALDGRPVEYLIGQHVPVHLHDEHGNTVVRHGKFIEIVYFELDDNEKFALGSLDSTNPDFDPLPRGTLVFWDDSKPYWVVEWQPNNGIVGCYWLIDSEGGSATAGTEELSSTPVFS